MQPAQLAHDVLAGAQKQVIRIGQQDVAAQCA
jgi:hypothetical protein